VRWIKPVGLPLAYLIGVVWAMQPPPPTYTLPDKTVIDVTDTGGPALLHAPAAIYPEAALRRHVEGTVRLRVSIDADGRPAKVEAEDGPPILIPAAVDAVRQWQFTAVQAETEIQVPFLLWHPGPRKVEAPQPVQQAPAYAGRGRHGTVRVVATVDETGRVESAKAVTGPRRLMAAAEANLRRWSFRPELHDGKPDRGTIVIDVRF
jgi:TonB family protein